MIFVVLIMVPVNPQLLICGPSWMRHMCIFWSFMKRLIYFLFPWQNAILKCCPSSIGIIFTLLQCNFYLDCMFVMTCADEDFLTIYFVSLYFQYIQQKYQSSDTFFLMNFSKIDFHCMQRKHSLEDYLKSALSGMYLRSFCVSLCTGHLCFILKWYNDELGMYCYLWNSLEVVIGLKVWNSFICSTYNINHLDIHHIRVVIYKFERHHAVLKKTLCSYILLYCFDIWMN